MIVQELFSVLGFKTDESSLKTAQASIDGVLSKIQGVSTKLAFMITAPLAALGVAAVKSAANMEDQNANFTILLGSAEKAKTLMEDLVQMGAKTPFETADLTEASKLLLAYGMSAEKVLPTLNLLGDVSLGNKEKLGRLTYAFSQIISAGRLMGQDLLQLVSAGFNPLQIISEKTGRSMIDLKKDMEGGKISSEMVMEAFKSATSEGGRFFRGMDIASQTLNGRLSTLRDNINIFMRGVVEKVFPVIKGIVEYLMKMFEWLGSVNITIKTTVFVLGAIVAVAPLVVLAFSTMAVAGIAFQKVLGMITTKATSAGVVVGVLIGDAMLTALAVAAAIGIVVLAIDDVVTYLNGGESFIGKFLAPWAKIGPKIKAEIMPCWILFKDAMSDILVISKNVFGFVANIFSDNTKAAEKNMEVIVAKIVSLAGNLVALLVPLVFYLIGAVTKALVLGLAGLMDKLDTLFWKSLYAIFAGVSDYIGGVFKKAWESIKDTPLGKLLAIGGNLAVKGAEFIMGSNPENIPALASPNFGGGVSGIQGLVTSGRSKNITTTSNEISISVKPDITVPAGTSEQQMAFIKDSSDLIFKKGLEAMTRQITATSDRRR